MSEHEKRLLVQDGASASETRGYGMVVVDKEVDTSFLGKILLDTQVCLCLCILLTFKVDF